MNGRKNNQPVSARDASVGPASHLNADEIRGIRQKLGISQSLFAQALNVSSETVKGWEQGKRVPDGASLRLLEIVEDHPEWVVDALEPRPRSIFKA